MANSEQIYIVRVRPAGKGAVVEDVRRREHRHVADPSEVGPLIVRWTERPPQVATSPGPDLEEDTK